MIFEVYNVCNHDQDRRPQTIARWKIILQPTKNCYDEESEGLYYIFTTNFVFERKKTIHLGFTGNQDNVFFR